MNSNCRRKRVSDFLTKRFLIIIIITTLILWLPTRNYQQDKLKAKYDTLRLELNAQLVDANKAIKDLEQQLEVSQLQVYVILNRLSLIVTSFYTNR